MIMVYTYLTRLRPCLEFFISGVCVGGGGGKGGWYPPNVFHVQEQMFYANERVDKVSAAQCDWILSNIRKFRKLTTNPNLLLPVLHIHQNKLCYCRC